MPITRRDFLAASGAVALTSTVRGQTRAYTLETEAAGKTLKDPSGRVVLSYLTEKPAGVPLAGNSVCCIHPFNTIGGERATDIAPADHRDHRGIFFAWHDMSFTKAGQILKGDFWGWGRFAPTAGRVIRNREVRLVVSTDELAEVAVSNEWLIDENVVLHERTTLRTRELTSTPASSRVLDLTFVFTSDYDVTLNRMAFTGFCFRCRKEGPYSFADAHGEVTLPNSTAADPDSDWPARDWYAHTVRLPNGAVVSSAVIDHPSNPSSRWHGARSVSFLNPCVAAPAPVTIPAGTPLTLRYRAMAFDGVLPAAWVSDVATAWRRS